MGVFPPADASVGEYFKLSNLTGEPIVLSNAVGEWRIDGPDFDFSPGTTIPAGGSLLVVSFDPVADVEALETFRRVYGLDDGEVGIVGPFKGSLSNSGKRIALERPLAPDPPDTQIS